MMNLHLNKENFGDVIQIVSDQTNIPIELIEKDYYLTMILKQLVTLDQRFLFKGGTSLSKCFGCISRFSEDIDINYIGYENMSISQKRNIKDTVVEAVNQCQLVIVNLDQIRSRRVFNRYRISYPKVFQADYYLKQEVILETAFQTQSFPYEIRKVQSIIGEYFERIGRIDIIQKYCLESFEMYVQSLTRTFIDKIFALVDYSLSGKVDQHSRHLYDLYHLNRYVQFDSDFVLLFHQVEEMRRPIPYCYSAKKGVSLKKELLKIIDEDIYHSDYMNITSFLIYDCISYPQVIDNLKIIINKLDSLSLI